MRDIRSELQNLANKLRVMWGNNPDSILIEEAIQFMTDPHKQDDEKYELQTHEQPRGRKGAAK